MKNVTLSPTVTQQRHLDSENDVLLRQLIHATPAQVSAYMTTNVTTLAQARTVLTSLALAVRHLYLKGN